MSAAERWTGALPAQLAVRVDEVHAAAMHLAYAARPLPSSPGVSQYWATLTTLQQLRWFTRAARDVSEAMGIA